MRRAAIIGFCVAVGLATTASHAQTSESEAPDPFDMAVAAVHDKEYRRAIQLFSPLAEADAVDAQFNLALLIKAGLGQPKNFSESYYWAVLSDLGGEQRAQPMVSELSDMLPIETKNAIHQRIIIRLREQIEQGEPKAILKFARIHSEFLEEPDYEIAYIWYSIAQAIGQRGGFTGSAEVAKMLEMDVLIAAQNKAVEVYTGSPFAQVETAPATN
jgi:TPR repeat protein